MDLPSHIKVMPFYVVITLLFSNHMKKFVARIIDVELDF